MNAKNRFISAFYKQRGVDSSMLNLTLQLPFEDNWKVSTISQYVSYKQ